MSSRRDFRVLIVEDHLLFAESLELALSMEGYGVRRLPLPEGPGTTSTLVSGILRARPRVVLLDLDLGHLGDAIPVIEPVARAGVNVVVVTGAPDRARWGECVRYGARKVLSKSRPLGDILGTVRRLHQGLQVMTVTEREELLTQWQVKRATQERDRARLERLTVRERQVLGHLMRGLSVRDIALRSVVSEATVRTQVKSILAKLEVSSQLAAVGLAHHLEWRPPQLD